MPIDSPGPIAPRQRVNRREFLRHAGWSGVGATALVAGAGHEGGRAHTTPSRVSEEFASVHSLPGSDRAGAVDGHPDSPSLHTRKEWAPESWERVPDSTGLECGEHAAVETAKSRGIEDGVPGGWHGGRIVSEEEET